MRSSKLNATTMLVLLSGAAMPACRHSLLLNGPSDAAGSDVLPHDAVIDTAVDAMPSDSADAGQDSMPPDVVQDTGPVLPDFLMLRGNYSCVRMTDRTVRCFGANEDGQLGTGSRAADGGLIESRAQPLGVPTITNVDSLGGGRGGGCVVSSGHVRCWGSANNGEIADGLPGPIAEMPVDGEFGMDPLVEVAGGSAHLCARSVDDEVRCRGLNEAGSCGGGSAGYIQFPPTVNRGLGSLRQLVSNNYSTYVLNSAGEVWGWGAAGRGQLAGTFPTTCGVAPMQYACSASAVRITLPMPAVQIAAGGYHACALLMDRTVACWGWNGGRQLGRISTTTCADPDPPWNNQPCERTAAVVPGLTDVESLAVGGFHTCVARRDGTVWCWGWNGYLSLTNAVSLTSRCMVPGDGEASCTETPVQIGGLASIRQVASGNAHVCALRNDSAVFCWGFNNFGQAGTTSSARSPTRVMF